MSVSEAKRVFIVSELYYPETSATGYYLTNIAEGLVGPDKNMQVVCGWPRYNNLSQKPQKKEIKKGVAIRRCWSTRFDQKSLLGRVINVITVLFTIAAYSLRAIKKDDVVVVVTNPPVLPAAVKLICKLKGAKCVVLVHDVYPNVLIPLGLLKRHAFIYRHIAWINRKVFKSADKVIVLGRDMKLLMERDYGVSQNVEVIEHWADLDNIKPLKREGNKFVKDLRLKGKFVILYSGNHGRTHELENIIEAANLLRNSCYYQFLFVGDGSRKHELESLSQSLGLRNVTFMNFVDKKDLSEVMNAADVCVVSLMKGMAGISVPSKMYNIMAAGKPIVAIADEDTEIAMVVNENKNGYVVPPKEPQKLTDVLVTIGESRERLRYMGMLSRRAAERKYSYSRSIQKYSKAIESLYV